MAITTSRPWGYKVYTRGYNIRKGTMSGGAIAAVITGIAVAFCFILLSELPFLYLGDSYAYCWYYLNSPLVNYIDRFYGYSLAVFDWRKHILIVGLNSTGWACIVAGCVYGAYKIIVRLRRVRNK